MKTNKSLPRVAFCMASVVLLCAQISSFAADSKIIAPGETLRKLADGFKFTEGPACDANGNIFFTDQPNDRIMEWSVDGKLSTFMQPSGRANGLCFDDKGNLWACADEKTELWRIAPNGKHVVVVKEYDGKYLNGPNDVWIRPDGGMYLTDPYYQRSYWDHKTKAQSGEYVFFLPKKSKKLMLVADDLKQPKASSARRMEKFCTWRTSARTKLIAIASNATAPLRTKNCSAN